MSSGVSPIAAAFKYLGWWEMSLLLAGGWNQMVCKVPSNPNHSRIL